MGKLGDHFPPEEKRRHIRRQLRPGLVLFLDCDFTTPPKPKFVVLVCVQPRPVLFVVNSVVSPYIRARPHLLACQVRLSKSDYPFLARDSYLDCSQPVYLTDDGAITGQLVGDLTRQRGELTKATRSQVVTVVRAARTLSQRDKAAIEAALARRPKGSP